LGGEIQCTETAEKCASKLCYKQLADGGFGGADIKEKKIGEKKAKEFADPDKGGTKEDFQTLGACIGPGADNGGEIANGGDIADGGALMLTNGKNCEEWFKNDENGGQSSSECTSSMELDQGKLGKMKSGHWCEIDSPDKEQCVSECCEAILAADPLVVEAEEQPAGDSDEPQADDQPEAAEADDDDHPEAGADEADDDQADDQQQDQQEEEEEDI